MTRFQRHIKRAPFRKSIKSRFRAVLHGSFLLAGLILGTTSPASAQSHSLSGPGAEMHEVHVPRESLITQLQAERGAIRLERNDGDLVVQELPAGSVLGSIGLRQGDRIVSIGSMDVVSGLERRHLRVLTANSFDVEIIREGEPHILRIHLED